MSAVDTLRASLRFAARRDRPAIQAMIDRLLQEYPEGRSGTAREASSTGMGDDALGKPGVVGVQPAAPFRAPEGAEAPDRLSAPPGGGHG